jgi:hypothetical protein
MEVAQLDADAGALVVAADDCGEGAAGAGAPPVWVKYADGVVDEVEREVRETRLRHGAPCAASLTSHCAAVPGCADFAHAARPGAVRRRRGHARGAAAASEAGGHLPAASENAVCLTRATQVGPEVLALILEYCRFHRAEGRSDKVCRRAACQCGTHSVL